jgi:hypothetical protein
VDSILFSQNLGKVFLLEEARTTDQSSQVPFFLENNTTFLKDVLFSKTN